VITKSFGHSPSGPFSYFEASRGESTWGYVDEDIPALPTQQFGVIHTYNKAYTEFNPEMAIVIQIVGGAELLESRTLADVLETGENTLVLMSDETPKTNFEIVQFTGVSLDGEDATLTGLMRGVRGTEETGRAGFTRGSVAVFVDPDIATLKVLPLDEIGVIQHYATETARESQNTSTTFDYTHEGNDLKPLPVGHTWMQPAVGSRSGSPVVVSGYRRTRIGGDADLATDATNIPWGEEKLEFEMDLMEEDGSGVSKTYKDPDANWDDFSAGYSVSVSDRTGAGYTNDEAFTVRIYQVSRVPEIGRGIPREITG
jgi:hypothetical protein